MAISQTTRPGTIRGTIPVVRSVPVADPIPVERARPVKENRTATVQRAEGLARKDAGTAPTKIKATPAQLSVSSFAAGKLRWNQINGSGPVSDRAFIRAHGQDSTHSHDWVFRKRENM